MILSIITITFDNFSELKETLDSVPKLDFIESVVINGGSCPQTKEFLNSYKGKSISEKDNGIADAFNKGIKLSSGELIMFLNSGDVLIDPQYLTAARERFISNQNIIFVHSNMILKHANSELYMKPSFSNLGRGMPYLHPTMIFRRTVFDKVGLFNTNYRIAMDFDFIVRITKAKLEGYYIENSFPVVMEGSGKSIINEGNAIRECFRILVAHRELNLKNFSGYLLRYFLFLVRRLLTIAGQDDLLTKFKKQKHSR